jgi:hypothetical protein
MNTHEFIQTINKLRLANKHEWYFLTGIVNGKSFRFKAFDTSIQILEVNGLRYNSTYDITVKDFKKHLEHAANH